jgi:hypothetical protein
MRVNQRTNKRVATGGSITTGLGVTSHHANEDNGNGGAHLHLQ